MSDIGEDFAAMKAHSKLKKERNLAYSTNLLVESGIEFESKNNGVHLIVTSDLGLIDFWPSTGKFKVRSQTKYGRGVKNLINLIKRKTTEQIIQGMEKQVNSPEWKRLKESNNGI